MIPSFLYYFSEVSQNKKKVKEKIDIYKCPFNFFLFLLFGIILGQRNFFGFRTFTNQIAEKGFVISIFLLMTFLNNTLYIIQEATI